MNAAEAKTVNLIFRRYLDLGCMRALRDDLTAKQVISKSWTSSTGMKHGGAPFDRGALYCLLKNRVYLGETTHKGNVYPGEHDAIVARELFEAVQERFATSRRRKLGKPSVPQDAPLAGLVFDERGTPMMPSYSAKPDGRRYTYYASRLGKDGRDSGTAISRIPAAALEGIVAGALTRVGLSPATGDAREFRPLVQRIEIEANAIMIRLDRMAALARWRTGEAGDLGDRSLVAHWRAGLCTGEKLADGKDDLVLKRPVRARFRGGRARILHAPATAAQTSMPDTPLIKALARAHRWRATLEAGEVGSIEALAAKLKQERRHVGRVLDLAFLAPDLTRAILHGEQPPGLRLTHLLDADIPISWAEQRAMFTRLATAN